MATHSTDTSNVANDSQPQATQLLKKTASSASELSALDLPDNMPPALQVVPTVYATSPNIEEELQHFWKAGPEIDDISVDVQWPEQSLELLEKLGASPFPKGRFPLIGFLASTYEKVSRYAVEREED